MREDLNEYLSIGLEKNDLVIVGMSGGVDSSVTAALMHQAGFKIIGVTLKLGKTEKKIKSCCSDKDVQDAQDVAISMGFTHYTLDYYENFKEHVVDDFINEYSDGYTPSPCVRCNQKIKFGDLMRFAKKLGAKAVATGHYIKHMQNESGDISFCRAEDHNKDQTYFMSMVKKEYMNFIRFPLGTLTKPQVREIAEELNLSVAKKKESQDLCFIQDGSYRDMLKNLALHENKGVICDLKDNILGYHDGIENYTVGQRKGINISNGPWFVLKLIANENKVVIGRESDLEKSSFHIGEINIMSDEWFSQTGVLVKVRSRHNPIACYINNDEVVLSKPTISIAPGQICAFYFGDKLIGGARIK